MQHDDKQMSEKTLTPEARRALAEAEERRRNAQPVKLPKEINGRDGPEPTRFGDWETKGLTSDF
jgi:hypothetical protein